MAGQPPLGPFKEIAGAVIIPGMSANVAIPGSESVITVTPPAAITTVDTVPIGPPGFSAVVWAIEAEKSVGGGFLSEFIRGQTDGTSASSVEEGTVLQPGNGTYDLTWTVDVSAGSMRLRVTPGSTGWTIRAIRLVELPT